MKLTDAIDRFIADRRAEGYINSPATESSYRSRLGYHARDAGNRDPGKTGREDVKRTLARWEHPNSRSHARSVLCSFYDWCMEEGYRDTNPARMTRRPRKREPLTYRLTREECVRMLEVCETDRERRVIGLGLLAGARNAELRSFQRRHFQRPGLVRIIGKGNKERWVPVLPELQEIVDCILAELAAGDYAICARRARGGNVAPTERMDLRQRKTSSAAVNHLVKRVALRAGIAGNVTPHSLRHAFAQHVERYAGIRVAQAALGHKSIATTETYVGGLTIDELVVSMGQFRYQPAIASPITHDAP